MHNRGADRILGMMELDYQAGGENRKWDVVKIIDSMLGIFSW